MATPADRSNNDAPQDHTHDPHSHDETRAIPEPPPEEFADESSIDLGHPVTGFDPLNPGSHGSSSGISVVDWASLVEEVPAEGTADAEAAAFEALSDDDVVVQAPIPAPQAAAPPPAPIEMVHHTEERRPDAAETMAMPAEALAFHVEEETPPTAVPQASAAPPAADAAETMPMAADEVVFSVEDEIPMAELPEAAAPPPEAAPAEVEVAPVEEDIPMAELPEPASAAPQMEAPPPLPADESGFAEVEEETTFLEASPPEMAAESVYFEPGAFAELSPSGNLHDAAQPPEMAAESVYFEPGAFAELLPSDNLREAAQPPEIVEESAFVEEAPAEEAVDLEAAAFAELSPSGNLHEAAQPPEVIEESAFVEEVPAEEAVDLEAAAFAELSPSGNLHEAAQPPEIVEESAVVEWAPPEEAVDLEAAAFAELSPSGSIPPVEFVEDQPHETAAPPLPMEAAVVDVAEPTVPADLEAAAFAELSSGVLDKAAQPPQIVEETPIAEAPSAEPPALVMPDSSADIGSAVEIPIAWSDTPPANVVRDPVIVTESSSAVEIPIQFMEDAPDETTAPPPLPQEALTPPPIEVADSTIDIGSSVDLTAAFDAASPSGVLSEPAIVSETASGTIMPVEFIEDMAPETVAAPVEPVSEIDQVAEAAFAAPDMGHDETPFTPEAMFADDETPTIAQPPRMELDSGRKLHEIVDLGADVVDIGESGIDLSGVLPPASEEEPIVAEIEEEAAGEEEVLDLGAEAVVEGSSGSVSAVLAEIVESDSAIPPPVPTVVEDDSAIDLNAVEVTDASGSPPADVDKAKVRTREVPVLQVPAPPAEDDFFDAAEPGVPVEIDESAVEGEALAALSAESSAVDLGSTPEIPTLPLSAVKRGEESEIADIDLAALEASASSSQLEAGKRPASRKEEGKWAEDEFASLSPTAEVPVIEADGEEIATVEGSELFDAEMPIEPVADEAVAEADEDEAPKKKGKKKKEPKARRRTGVLVGSASGGILVGIGVCVALWVFGVDPPGLSSVRAKFGGKVPAPPPQRGGQVNLTPEQLIAAGRLDEAKPALENVDDKDPDRAKKLTLRGQLAWQAYARANAANGIKADADDVKKAIDDFKKADTAEAYFRLGVMYENTGNLAEAKKSYQAGEAKCKDEAEKRRFQNAQRRVSLQEGAGGAGARLGPQIDETMLALVLIALLPPADAPKEPEEAGYKFFEALEVLAKSRGMTSADQAKAQEKAITLLEEAAKNHKVRRLLRMGMQQNPDSDPNEDIFLQCVKELTAALKSRQNLLQKYETADAEKAIETATAKAMAEGNKMLLDVAKAVGAEKPEDIGKAVNKLVADRKSDGDKIAALEKKVADVAGAVGAKPEDIDKAVKQFQDAGKKLVDAKIVEKPEDIAAGIDKLLTARQTDAEKVAGLEKKLGDSDAALKTANEAFDQAAKDLIEHKHLDDKEKPTVPVVLKSIKNVIALANMKDPDSTIRNLQKKASTLETTVDKMAADQKAKLAELTGDFKTQTAKLTAEHEAEIKKINDGFIAEKAKITANIKNTDLLALGLATPEEAAGNKPPELVMQKRLANAMNVVDTALAAASPEQKAPLLAQRSLLLLEVALDRNAEPNDKLIKDALTDAQGAGDTAAGHYALGRIYEYRGDMQRALESYTKAADMHKDADATGLLYKSARLRALAAPKGPARPGLDEKPPEPKVGRLSDEEEAQQRLALVLLTVLLQPVKTPEQIEAERLADEILKNDKAPFDAKAEALRLKGMWTEALKTYAAGLKPFLKPSYSRGLADLIDNHPSLKRGTSMANPLAAEAYYGNGVRMYHARQYADAEKQFQAAVDNDDQDARYFYYLALSQLAQNKKDAYENISEGAALERAGKPSRVAVNDSLERVQGGVRRTLDTERAKPPKP